MFVPVNLFYLIRPPFLRVETAVTSDSKRTTEIACVRVHVERAIQRITLITSCQGSYSYTIVIYVNGMIV